LRFSAITMERSTIVSGNRLFSIPAMTFGENVEKPRGCGSRRRRSAITTRGTGRCARPSQAAALDAGAGTHPVEGVVMVICYLIADLLSRLRFAAWDVWEGAQERCPALFAESHRRDVVDVGCGHTALPAGPTVAVQDPGRDRFAPTLCGTSPAGTTCRLDLRLMVVKHEAMAVRRSRQRIVGAE